MQRGLEECLRAGLYPLAFETPHYAASTEHYRTLASTFSECYERRNLVDQENAQQYFPYPTTDFLGQAVVPENLGYVPIDHPGAGPIIAAAKRLEVVRDPVASFFFHPFMPSTHLEQIVDALQTEGYNFISLKDFSPRVRIGDCAITTTPERMTLSPLQPYLKITKLDKKGERSEQVRPVERGKTIALDLNPPAGGTIAACSPIETSGTSRWQLWEWTIAIR